MKKIAIIASLAIIGFSITAFVAPKVSTTGTFEGVVTYSMSVDNPQAASLTQGSSVKIYMKGEKVKTVVDMMQGAENFTTIVDKKTPDEPVVLINVMGNKYQLKNDPSKKKDKTKPAIKYTDETKTIANYNCHKAEITVTGQDGQPITTNVYYTEDLPSFSGDKGEFEGLKGFPLEYTINQQGVNISMSATSVDKQTLGDDIFAVPSGYKLMTAEEMQEDIKKQMGGGN